MQTENLLEAPKQSKLKQKQGIRCPKCRNLRTTRTESTKGFTAYECPACGYAWEEPRIAQPLSRLKCSALMTITVLAYLIGI